MLEYRMDRYITKPYSFEDMVNRICEMRGKIGVGYSGCLFEQIPNATSSGRGVGFAFIRD
jgi:hypothetical protein